MEAATVPQIWREARVGREFRALRRSGLLTEPRTDIGHGLPVMLIPGLLAPDASLSFLARYLRRNGFRPQRAGIRSNVDCSEREMKRLVKRLEAAKAEFGSRVAIVGQSRGGVFGRALAVRRPDLVGGVVTLGSPLVDPLTNIHPFLHLQLELIASMGDRKWGRFATHGCIDEEILEQLNEHAKEHRLSRVLARRLEKLKADDEGCCTQFWSESRAKFPGEVSYLSIYSRTDGIVNVNACLDPDARHREVVSSHCGMAFNVDVFRAALSELSEIADRERR